LKPLLHAKISARRFGGEPDEYIEIHDWFDQTKAHIPDARHRMILHNSFGIYLCEQQFGEIVHGHRMPYITLRSGKQVSVRDIAEQHVIDDLGSIPTLSEVFQDVAIPMEIRGGPRKFTIHASDIVYANTQEHD
jgi:hypothetical protein